MRELEVLESHGFEMAADDYYDETHHSAVLFKDGIYVILDYDLCRRDGTAVFDYSKYCEMQNRWMSSADKLYRFYIDQTHDTSKEILDWLNNDPDSFEVSDRGGSFDKSLYSKDAVSPSLVQDPEPVLR